MTKNILIVLLFSCGHFSRAQVPVKYEPRHHNLFENEYIRVLDVNIGPRDTTLFHVHNTPSVFFTFTKTSTTSQLIGREPSRSTVSNPGPPSYDSLGTPRIHRVWNNDTTWFHVMDIELKGEKPKTNQPVLQHPLLTLAFNRYLANGYRLQLKAGDSIDLPSTTAGYLLVSQGDGEIQIQEGNSKQLRFMKPGHYIWIESGKTFSVKNSGTLLNLMLLQLK
jgi:hypothetical protein